MKVVISILLLFLHLIGFVPDNFCSDNDFSEKNVEKESTKIIENEMENDEAIVLTRFRYIEKRSLQLPYFSNYYALKNIQPFPQGSFYSFFQKENFYLWYSNIRV